MWSASRLCRPSTCRFDHGRSASHVRPELRSPRCFGSRISRNPGVFGGSDGLQSYPSRNRRSPETCNGAVRVLWLRENRAVRRVRKRSLERLPREASCTEHRRVTLSISGFREAKRATFGLYFADCAPCLLGPLTSNVRFLGLQHRAFRPATSTKVPLRLVAFMANLSGQRDTHSHTHHSRACRRFRQHRDADTVASTGDRRHDLDRRVLVRRGPSGSCARDRLRAEAASQSEKRRHGAAQARRCVARFPRLRRGHRAGPSCIARADKTLGGSTLARGATYRVELANSAEKNFTLHMPDRARAGASPVGIRGRESRASRRLLSRGTGGAWRRQRCAWSAPASPRKLLCGFRYWAGRAQHRNGLPQVPRTEPSSNRTASTNPGAVRTEKFSP